MNPISSFILSAPFIFPIDQPMIHDGAVIIQNDLIVDLGKREVIEKKYKEKGFVLINLPQTVILPGFVNAHSHLELSCLKHLSYPGNFTEWIQKVVTLKPRISEEDYKKGIQQGINSMLQSGITTVGDHVSFNTDLEWILKSPLRGILFIEVLGVVKEIAENILEAATNLEKLFHNHSSLFQIYASPHSVHALHPEILPKLFTKKSKVFSIHLGESKEEEEYFKHQSGPLYDFITQRVQKALSRGERVAEGRVRGDVALPSTSSSLQTPPFPPHPGPLPQGEGECLMHQEEYSAFTAIQLLEKEKLLSDQIMAVHCNYLENKDLDLLEKYKISVVHCPSSHHYFSHLKFPLNELKKRGINIALGTDSLASGESLSMLDQIRTARKNYPEIKNEEWLKIATLGGAKALRMEGEVGSISKGKKADLIGFKLQSKDPRQMVEEILESKNANFVMINGKKILKPVWLKWI